MSTLFSCSVHQKDVAGSRGRASGRGVKRWSPPEVETLLAFGRAMKAGKFACFLIFVNTKKITDICVALQKLRLISYTLARVWAPYHHRNFSRGQLGEQRQRHGEQLFPLPPSGAAHVRKYKAKVRPIMCLCENIFKHFANLKLKSHRFARRTVVYKLTDQIWNAVFYNASYWLSCVKKLYVKILLLFNQSVIQYYDFLHYYVKSPSFSPRTFKFRPISNKTLQNNYKIILFLFNKDELLAIALKIKFHVFYKFCWPGMHKRNSNKCPKCSEFCEFSHKWWLANFSIYSASQKVRPFIFVRFLSDFAKFWQARSPRNLKQTHNILVQIIHIV